MDTHQKKGNIGIGSLVILISLLMVVAITATILIQTSGSLQQETMKTGDQAKAQISNSITPIDLLLYKDSSDEYTIVTETIKLTSGSEIIKFEDLIILINLEDESINLEYQGPTAPIENSFNGFFTRGSATIDDITANTLETETDNVNTAWHTFATFDIDLDGTNEEIKLCSSYGAQQCPENSDGSHLAVRLSSTSEIIYITLRNSTGDTISDRCTLTDGVQEVSLINEPIGEYATITLIGDLPDDRCEIRPGIDTTTFRYEIVDKQLTNDIDLDMDNNDFFRINSTHAILNFSSGEIINIPLGQNIASAPVTLSVNEKITTSSGEVLGTLEISGTTNLDNILGESVDVNVRPTQNSGYYVTNYLQTGTHHRPGNLIESDLVQIHMALPRPIAEEETLTIRLIPINGAPINLNVETKVGMNKNVIELFP